MPLPYRYDAIEIAQFLHDNHDLPMLNDKQLIEFAARLFDISDDGCHFRFFHAMFKKELPRQKINSEIEKAIKAIHVLSNIFGRDDDAADEVKFHFDWGDTNNANIPKEVQVIDWINFCPQMAVYALKMENKLSENIDIRYRQLDYKTFQIGYLLPNLFRYLYGIEKIGKSVINDGYDDRERNYCGDGVTFILECSDVLGHTDLMSESIRQAEGRVKKADVLRFYESGK